MTPTLSPAFAATSTEPLTVDPPVGAVELVVGAVVSGVQVVDGELVATRGRRAVGEADLGGEAMLPVGGLGRVPVELVRGGRVLAADAVAVDLERDSGDVRIGLLHGGADADGAAHSRALGGSIVGHGFFEELPRQSSPFPVPPARAVKTIREATRRRASGMASLRLSTGGVIPAFIGTPETISVTRSG